MAADHDSSSTQPTAEDISQDSRWAAIEHIRLDSLSLVFDEASSLKGPSLSSLFNQDLSRFHLQEVTKEKEFLAPSAWNMPEVFRRKLTAYSEHYFNEVNEQNRLASLLRYNFSDGVQVSAKDILRHLYHKRVPREILPQLKGASPVFAQWPLTQQKDAIFMSQSLREVEEIIQSLLSSVATKVRQGQVTLYLQSRSSATRGLVIKDIQFDPGADLDWRVEFVEKNELHSEFKLISAQKQPFAFFESFAVEPTSGLMLVHPWRREWSLLNEVMVHIQGAEEEWRPEAGEMPCLEIEGEMEARTVLKHLRGRSIPVRVTGTSATLPASQSVTDLMLDEKGHFRVQHRARVSGQKDLVREGWTPRSVLFLKTLSLGLPFLMNTDPKDAAGRSRRKRDWDMKLLKHLGILQYLMLETLSVHFDGTLTDGRVVEATQIWSTLSPHIQALLITGSGGALLTKDLSLAELCSQSVLNFFEVFVSKVLEASKVAESFYSEQGEVILEGVVDREFRLIYELLKKMALVSGGEAFKKSRTSFLSKIWGGDPEKDAFLKRSPFFIPQNNKEVVDISGALETLQVLIPAQFQIFFKGQALEELSDDDFKVDFFLQGEGTPDFNWFELNPRFFLKGHELNPEEMAHFGSGGVIEFEGRIYLVPKKQMPSLRRLERFWQKLQKGKKETGKKTPGEKIYHLPRHQVLELLALRASGYGIRGDHEWKKLCEFYDNLGKNDRELVVPPTIKAELKSYQASGVLWLQDLYNLRLGALLADDMGLGKTLQTLTFLETLRLKNELGQVLIVVPSSLIFNWQSEIEKFTPELPVMVFSNKDKEQIGVKLERKENVLVICTYGLLMEHEKFLMQYNWKVLIFDEAQNLKNITTKRTSAARSLNAHFKICLTGTPMENHYGEFYSLVDLLVPGSLGKVEDFRRQFVNTEIILHEQIDELKLKMKPLLLRRTKKEILDQLPEKQETRVSIAFEERQKEIYRDIALSYNQKVQETLLVQSESSVQLQMLTALLRLRQACSDPAALPNVRYDKVPPKLEALSDSLQEIVESGESALVFTQFLQTLEHTEKLLKAANIPVFVLHGGVSTKQRQKLLSDFNATPGGAVLVMTLKTGGVGLNLTKASYVFHLEPWWNPSVENQATDRAHRLGQNKAVQVFRYIMHESLEEKIELLKDRKQKKFESLFTTTEKDVELGSGSAALSKSDFDLLLGIGES